MSGKNFNDWIDIMCGAIGEGKAPEEIDFLLADMPTLDDLNRSFIDPGCQDFEDLNNGRMVNGTLRK